MIFLKNVKKSLTVFSWLGFKIEGGQKVIHSLLFIHFFTNINESCLSLTCRKQVYECILKFDY